VAVANAIELRPRETDSAGHFEIGHVGVEEPPAYAVAEDAALWTWLHAMWCVRR
jgi:hypothetical protein